LLAVAPNCFDGNDEKKLQIGILANEGLGSNAGGWRRFVDANLLSQISRCELSRPVFFIFDPAFLF